MRWEPVSWHWEAARSGPDGDRTCIGREGRLSEEGDFCVMQQFAELIMRDRRT
jgi:hypothetical protein